LNRAFGGNVRFKIHGRRGKDVQPYSAIEGEQETLFRSGTRVRVLNRQDRGSIVEVEVEEVEDG